MGIARRHLLALAASSATASLGLTACSTNPSASQEDGFAGGDGSFVLVAPGKRAVAPVLTGVDLDGKALTTKTYAGQVLVLNVWGSWCAPCRKEAPDLVKAADQLKGAAQVLGINTRDLTTDPARAFMRAFKVTYPSFFDPNGALLLDLAALPPNAIPSTVIVDKQGRVAARVTGATTAATIVGVARDVAAGQ